MIANREAREYDCGLGYPVLVPPGYPLDEQSGDTNVLHARIAHAVALRPGPLTGKEVRFLRENLGLTPEELSERIDFPTDLIRACESGNGIVPRESDVEIRRLVFTHHDLTIPSFAALYALYGSIDPGHFMVTVCLHRSALGTQVAA